MIKLFKEQPLAQYAKIRQIFINLNSEDVKEYNYLIEILTQLNIDLSVLTVHCNMKTSSY